MMTLTAVPGARAAWFAADSPDSATVTIADITDFHGHIERGTDVARAFEIARSHNPGAMIPVSAGDLVGGSPYDSASQNDEPTLRMAQAWGLHISALGNHELDRGVHDFNERIADPAHGIDWLCANARKTVKTNRLKDYVIRTVNGRRIAFIGAITDALRAVTTPSIMRDITLDEPAVGAINRVADQLSDGNESNGEADAIVVLLHADAEAATKKGVKGLNRNVDLVYAGHSHAVKSGRTAAGAPVIEAGSFGADMAVQDLTITGYGRHAHVSVNNVDLGNGAEHTSVAGVMSVTGLAAHPKQAAWLSAGAAGDTAVSQCERIVADAERAAARKGSQVVGTIAPGSYFGKVTNAESSLGMLVADAQREEILQRVPHVNGMQSSIPVVGFSNNGSLRTRNLDANGDGRITLREVDSMLALQFHTAYVTLTGKQLRAALAQQWREHDGRTVVGWLGVSSNVSYRYVMRDQSTGKHDDDRFVDIVDLTIDGQLIDDDDTVIAAGNSFLLQGGDRYTAFRLGRDYRELNVGYNQALIDYLEHHPRLESFR
ncbi:5'-nucleotidase C-terminal domain-containing protein [Bifidobacterium goeldii]